MRTVSEHHRISLLERAQVSATNDVVAVHHGDTRRYAKPGVPLADSTGAGEWVEVPGVGDQLDALFEHQRQLHVRNFIPAESWANPELGSCARSAAMAATLVS